MNTIRISAEQHQHSTYIQEYLQYTLVSKWVLLLTPPIEENTASYSYFLTVVVWLSVPKQSAR